jgi:hypothetical protein
MDSNMMAERHCVGCRQASRLEQARIAGKVKSQYLSESQVSLTQQLLGNVHAVLCKSLVTVSSVRVSYMHRVLELAIVT